MKEAGITIKIEKEIDGNNMLKDLFFDENSNKDDLLVKSNHELKELLKIAVQNENYESAAKIRDEISKRK